MEANNRPLELKSAIKYAFSLRFGAPYSPNSVSSIGIVFGGLQLVTLCQKYIYEAYANDELRIDITPGLVTAKVELKEVNSDKIVFVVDLNYDGSELVNFQEKTPTDRQVALIFGIKRGCDYYVINNAKDKAEDFSPIVLAGFGIYQ